MASLLNLDTIFMYYKELSMKLNQLIYVILTMEKSEHKNN